MEALSCRMALVVDFNKYIIVPILTEWLGVVEFGRLDTSLTNTKQRRVLLEIVRANAKFIERAHFEPTVMPLSPSMVGWMHFHGLELKSCEITCRVIREWSLCDLKLKKEINRLSKNMLSISVSGFGLIEVAVCAILERLRYLKSLTITNCLSIDTYVNAVVSTRLESLSIHDCRMSVEASVESQAVNALLRRQPQLRRLSLVDCPLRRDFLLGVGLTQLTVFKFRAVDMHLLAESNVLAVCGREMTNYSCNLLPNGEVLRHLVAHSSETLRVLNVSGCKYFDTAALVLLVGNCRNLTNVDISECRVLNSSVVGTMGRHLSKLRRVNLSLLSGVTDERIISLFSQCPSLTDLTVNNSGITSRSLAAIGEQLHCLSVHKLYNVSFGEVLMYCPLLTRLDLPGHYFDYERRPFHSLYPQCPNLRTLCLSYGEQSVTDDIMEQLFERCPGLTDVDISLCRVTDRAVFAAVNHTLALRTLKIDNTMRPYELTSEVVTAIAERQGRCLRTLDVKGLNVSPEDLLRLVVGLPRLQELRCGLKNRAMVLTSGLMLPPDLVIVG